jgi:hypothetical protein
MKPNSVYKIEKFLEREFNSAVGKLFLYDQNGDYLIFGKYVIKKMPKGEYLVTLKNTFTKKVFYKLKNAVSWCIFDNKNMISTSVRIDKLDHQLASIDAVIELHTKLFKTTKNLDSKLIYLAKLKEEKLKKNHVSFELNRYNEQSATFYKSNLF